MLRLFHKTALLKMIKYACIAALLIIFSYIGYIGVSAYQALNQIQNVADNNLNDPEQDVTDSDFHGGEEDADPSNDSADSELEMKYEVIRNGNTISLLIAGVDSEEGSLVGRSDVLMIAAIDLDKKESTLISIPRDTYVQIAGTDTFDKINHAYARNARTSMRTVENYLNIPVDYYVSVNFAAFEQFVDLLGGLQLDVERTIHHNERTDEIYLTPGLQQVNGEQALHYVRFRSDHEGDFGRNRRQQQVIKEILNQSTNIRSLTKIPEILNVLGNNVRTNMDTRTILNVMTNLSTLTGDNVEALRLTGGSLYVDNISYIKVEEEDRLEAEKALQDRLNVQIVPLQPE